MSEHDDLPRCPECEGLIANAATCNSTCAGAKLLIRSLQAQLETEHKAREEAEAKCKQMAQWYQEQGDTCLRRAESAERRLAEVEQDAKRYQELLSRYTTMLRIGEKLSAGIVFHTLTDWEPDHFDNVSHKISAAIDAAIK